MQLAQLKGIGVLSAQGLVNEVFYRDFDNRRQVGSYFGLTGTPYDSGESRREQGISKAGNHRARRARDRARLAVAAASARQRAEPLVPRAGRRHSRAASARITIVALARKLMVALWRYLHTGLVPTGAVLHPSF